MKNNHKELALFIPCYNEEKRLKFEAIQNFMQQNNSTMDFYFIDDGSLDHTGKIIKEQLVNGESSFLIQREHNRGKGNALREGILENLEKPYSYYGFIDADLDIPLKQVNYLYEQLKNSNCQIAISKRDLFSKFSLFNLRSVFSLLMILIANRLIRFSPRLMDTQCGCKLFKREAVEVCFRDIFLSEWLFDIEIFLRLKRSQPNSRQLICEVPVSDLQTSRSSNFHFSKNLKILKQIYIINSQYNK